MRLDQKLFVDSCQALQHVNVLSVGSQQQLLLSQQGQEVVGQGWLLKKESLRS